MGLTTVFRPSLLSAGAAYDIDAELVSMEQVSADPRVAGLAREIGSTAVTMSAGAVTGFFVKVGTGNKDWYAPSDSRCVIATGATSTLTLASLTGNRTGLIDFCYHVINGAGGDIDLKLQPNGSDTNTQSSGRSNGGAYSFNTQIYAGTVRGSSTSGFGRGTWYIGASGRRSMVFTLENYQAATSVSVQGGGEWTDTVTEFTSVTLAASAATMQSGSMFACWPSTGKVNT